MRHRGSSSGESGAGPRAGAKGADSSDQGIENVRTKRPHIYDNITRRLLQLGITLGVTTFVGLLVRYAVKEFDPSVSTITVTTARVDNRDIASLSVSKNFLERILEFIGESISIVAVIIPLGFPLCTIFNRHFAKVRAGSRRFEFKSDNIFSMIPKYLIIGDGLACHMPSATNQRQMRLRPLVRDTIYHLIKARLKPKLIVEDSYEDARKLGIRIGLIRRDHHRLAVIKSVDLLRNITDSRGDIKQGKVRYLLSRMKIMSQSTPADKSLLIYLIKHCESMPNENLAYLGYTFTDPEAMRLADCALTFADCDEDDVKRNAQVLLKSESTTFTDVYLFMVLCLIISNITQSYALYQISASVSACIYRFLSITVFQEQLLSHSQFVLLIFIQQLFAILALMTKWLSSLPQTQMRSPAAEMSHAATDDSLAIDLAESSSGSGARRRRSGSPRKQHHHQTAQHRRSSTSLAAGAAAGSSGMLLLEPGSLAQRASSDREHRSPNGEDEDEDDDNEDEDDDHGAPDPRATMSSRHGAQAVRKWDDDTLGSSSSLSDGANQTDGAFGPGNIGDHDDGGGGPAARAGRERQRRRLENNTTTTSSMSRHSTPGAGAAGSAHRHRLKRTPSDEQPVHLTGVDLDQAVINSKLATGYRQTFHNSSLIDDVTYRLVKLHIAYQILVMIIIMIFGNAMFQLNMSNNRQHQTLAFNSLVMNNIFNLANCFNQFGEFNLRSGFRNHPFFLCVLLLAVALQVTLSELNAFGLENLNPSQWFVCFVFALMSALIAPLTGQQARAGPGAVARPPGQQTATMAGAHGGLMMSPKSTDLADEQTGAGQRPNRRHTHSHSPGHNRSRHRELHHHHGSAEHHPALAGRPSQATPARHRQRDSRA